MDEPCCDDQCTDPVLPPGWQQIARFDGNHALLLEFQRDRSAGPRVPGFGITDAEAVRFAVGWMDRYDHRDGSRMTESAGRGS